jgi:hypothetical protein
VVLAAGIGTTVAHALAFDDATPCPVTIENGAPLLVCPSGSIGNPYSVKIVARGGCEPEFIIRIINGSLPPGLSIASNGQISGTPTQAGTFRFWLQVHDLPPSEGGPSWCTVPKNAEREFKISIDSALRLVTNTIPQNASVGVPYSAKLTPSGGDGTYTITLASGALPTGLTLGADGTISGTPSAAGVFHATVRLADTEGRTLDYAANFGVAARLAVGTVALKPGKVGRLYRARLLSTGGVPAKTWKRFAGKLPKGLRFDRTLGTLSGTPTRAGSYRVTFQVTDGLRVVAKKTLRIVVTT